MTVAPVYATRADLVDYAPADVTVPADPEATRLLRQASKEILRATLTALYDADTDGYPTNTMVREAFRDAACAQAVWWLGNSGQETGTGSTEYSSVSIGSVSLSKPASSGSTSGGGSTGRLAPAAITELEAAGVLPGTIAQAYG